VDKILIFKIVRFPLSAMLLAIDIGNSLIKFGVFDGDELIDKFSIATRRDYRADELHFDRLQYSEGKFLKIDRTIVSTVVPDLVGVVREASQRQFKVTPVFVDHNADFGFVNKYDPPESVGIDRLVNASAAIEKYGTPVIVSSFGTATVIDAISSKREFLGGVIAPGAKMMAASLHERTAQLPAVEIAMPEHLIGNSTVEAMRSGVVNGQIALADGLIKRLASELDSKPRVIATGGFAHLIANTIKTVSMIDENLTLEGLRLLAQKQ
jgi:type III pantothenate kinase